jgi:hypothetical protein
MAATAPVQSRDPEAARGINEAFSEGSASALQQLLQRRSQQFELQKIQQEHEFAQTQAKAAADVLNQQGILFPGGGRIGGQPQPAGPGPNQLPPAQAGQPSLPGDQQPTSQPSEGIPAAAAPGIMQGFMAAGGFKPYQEEQIAKQQGEALGTATDAMANDPEASPTARDRAKAYGQAFRSGGVRGPAAVEMLKELQAQHLRDINDRKMVGVTPGIDMTTLDGPGPAQSVTIHTSPTTGMQYTTRGDAPRGAEFNARVGRAQFLASKLASGVPLTPQEHASYERNVSIINTMQRQIQTPDMVQVNLGGFPQSLRGAGTPLAPKTVQPGEQVQSGNLVPQRGGPAEPGQATVKVSPDQAGWRSSMPNGYQYAGPYQVFNPPPQTPVAGEVGTRIPKPPSAAELKEVRDMEFSINSLRNIADRLDGLNLSDKDRQMAALKLAAPKAAGSIPLVGKLIGPVLQATTATSLPPELAELQAHITNSRNRYDTAIGGMRGGGSPSFYQITADNLISDLYNVNAPVHFRGLANDMQAALVATQRTMSEGRYQAPSVYLRPESAKGNRTSATPFGEQPKAGTAPASPQPATGAAGVSSATAPMSVADWKAQRGR